MKAATLKILENANLPPVQVRAIGEAIDQEVMGLTDTLATKADIENLRVATKADAENFRIATKADIENLRVATKADIENFRAATKADIENLRIATKADIENLRLATKADIETMTSTLLDRLLTVILTAGGCAIGAAGIVLGGVYFMMTHFKP